MAVKLLSDLENTIRPIKIGVGDVVHDRIDWTETIPEALDVELGFVNGGPDHLRICDIAGERYIHANDLAEILGIIPRVELCPECNGEGWIASSDKFGTSIQTQCEACHHTGKKQ